MITFGFSYEEGVKLIEWDALRQWNQIFLPQIMRNSMIEGDPVSAEIVLGAMCGFMFDKVCDYQCDQLAFEGHGPDNWLNDFPKAFDIIVGVA